jgi:hypothetical protein
MQWFIRASSNIELRDMLRNENCGKQLLNGGGQGKVPCLQIRKGNGNVSRLFESNEAIYSLRKLVAC